MLVFKVLAVDGLLMCLIFLINSLPLSHGKPLEKFGPFDWLHVDRDEYAFDSNHGKAQFPPVPEELQRNNLTAGHGIVLGRFGGKYVVNDLNSGGSHNTFLIGETGCGKTSTVVLDTLLSLGTETGVFALDIKPELYILSTKVNDPNVIVVNPMDKGSWGWNPLYMLETKPGNEQLLLDSMKNIAFSLLPINSAGGNDKFWTDSARDLLLSCLLYYYRKGTHNLIEIIDLIMGSPVKDTCEEIYNETTEGMVEHKLVARFVGMAEETLSGINGNLQVAIAPFISDLALRDSLTVRPRKANPRMLNDGKSIFLAIAEDKLDDYATLLHLIINQVIAEMEKRSSTQKNRPVLIIIDELARVLSVGRIRLLEPALEVLRSRSVSLLLISQSLEALQRAYNKPAVDGMLNNCPYKVIMSSSAKETQESVVRWAGKYREVEYSAGRNGKSKSTNRSFRDKNIVEASDLISLPQSGDLILISPWGYNRIHKVPYYRDRYLSRIASDIKNHNCLLSEAGKGGQDGNSECKSESGTESQPKPEDSVHHAGPDAEMDQLP